MAAGTPTHMGELGIVGVRELLEMVRRMEVLFHQALLQIPERVELTGLETVVLDYMMMKATMPLK